MPVISERSIAAFLEGVSWKLDEATLPLAAGVTLVDVRNSTIVDPYRSLRKLADRQDNLSDLEVAVVFEPPFSSEVPWDDLGSSLSQVCNLIAIMNGERIHRCRVIDSKDGFCSARDSGLAFDFSYQWEFLYGNGPSISPELAGNYQVGWQMLCRLLDSPNHEPRWSRALVHFALAWQSESLWLVCLNLELTLCILLNRSTGEQVMAKVSRIHGDVDRPAAEQLTELIFRVRPQLIQDGVANDLDLCKHTFAALQMTAGIMRRLLLDENPATATIS